MLDNACDDDAQCALKFCMFVHDDGSLFL